MRQHFEAGQLHKFIDEWYRITSDPFILNIVKHCSLGIDEENIGYLFSEDIQYVFNEEETLIMQQEINKLLEIHAIVETSREEQQILSPVFLRKNKTGDYRMVLNLEKLNRHVPYHHFKMENFELAIQLVNRGDFMASIDLKKAYYSVKIAEDQQKYLCFRWFNKFYQFTCLPNGFSDGPRLFTKLLKPVFSTLRHKGHNITSYIDDTLMCSNTLTDCFACMNDTIRLLQKVGFCINVAKSVLTPTTRIEYLGNVIDSVAMNVTLPAHRRNKILRHCSLLVTKKKEKIREVARLIGLLVAAFPAVELGKLHYRTLEREKIKALAEAGGDFSGWMNITEEFRTELTWWIENLENQDRKIFRNAPETVLFTDASDLGWAGCIHDSTTNGRWSPDEVGLHINARELLAILFSLKSFTSLISGLHVKVLCDNTTAICYVNEMGGVKSTICDKISKDIWNWCICHKAWLTASHIPGKCNVMADAASRYFNDRHEWQLNVRIFKDLCSIFGKPCIDLFASRLNKQVDRFCSWSPDPEATYIDAFTIPWGDYELVYLFPPFSLISRCLQKFRVEKARGWIIVPLWPTQPWMGMLLRMLVKDPRVIKSRKAVLVHPSTSEEHPMMQTTNLMACLLSGHTWEHVEYLQKVRTSSWPLGNPQLRDSTTLTSRGGHNFVIENTLIPLRPL